jgi:pantothenate kinase
MDFNINHCWFVLRVDLLVGDIYGTDYSRIGLASDVIASSFGKIMYSIQKGGSLDLKYVLI